jgi:hypothetical protein
VEARSFADTLNLVLSSLIKVDNLPSLVLATMSLVNNNFLGFLIFSSSDIENLVVLDVGNELTFIGEELPPS